MAASVELRAYTPCLPYLPPRRGAGTPSRAAASRTSRSAAASTLALAAARAARLSWLQPWYTTHSAVHSTMPASAYGATFGSSSIPLPVPCVPIIMRNSVAIVVVVGGYKYDIYNADLFDKNHRSFRLNSRVDGNCR